MAVSHIKSNPIADMTGTVTVFGSNGSTQTVAATDLVRPSDWNSVHNQYITIAGNTAGQSTFSGSNIVFGGGPNITLSGVNATRLDISAGAGGAGDGVNILAAGTQTANTTGTVAFVDSNGIAWGMSNSSQITASYSQSTHAHNLSMFAVSNTTQSSSGTQDVANVSFAGAGAVSVGVSNGSVVISAPNTIAQSNQTVGGYFVGNTTGQSSSSTWDARTVSFDGAGIVSVGASAGSIRISATQSNQNVTANNGGFAFQTLSFSNANGVSFGTSAGSAITGSVAAQTNQSAGIYAVGNTTGQSSSSTYDARTLSIDGAGIVSVGWSNSTLRVSATQSNQAFSAAGGSSAFQTLLFSDNAYASFTNNAGQLAVTALRGSFFAVSNTTQSTSMTQNLDALSFHGAGIASVGVSNGSVIISVPAGGGGGDGGVFAGVSTGGATAGSTGTVSTGNFVLVGSNGITLSQSTGAAGSAATVTIVGNARTATMWYPYNEAVNFLGVQGQGTFHINPVAEPYDELNVDRVAFPISVTNASNSTGSVTLTFLMGLYTKNGATLSSRHSTSLTTNWTFSGTNSASLQHGIRLYTLPWTTTIKEDRYYVGVGFRSTSGGANASISQVMCSQLNSNFSGIFGAASNATNQWPLGFGVYTASTTGVPSSIAFSQINGSASLAARPPSWFMISGTA